MNVYVSTVWLIFFNFVYKPYADWEREKSVVPVFLQLHHVANLNLQQLSF